MVLQIIPLFSDDSQGDYANKLKHWPFRLRRE